MSSITVPIYAASVPHPRRYLRIYGHCDLCGHQRELHRGLCAACHHATTHTHRERRPWREQARRWWKAYGWLLRGATALLGALVAGLLAYLLTGAIWTLAMQRAGVI